MTAGISLGVSLFLLLLEEYYCSSGTKGCYKEYMARYYNGTWSVTRSGLECQRWDKQYPHEHSMRADNFPEGNLCKAKNYCRDPDYTGFPWCYTMSPDTRWEACDIPLCGEETESGGFYCTAEYDCYDFTEEELSSGQSDKEICVINEYRTLSECSSQPECENCDRCCQKRDCLGRYDSAHYYQGTWHRTGSGLQCQAWNSQCPHEHQNNNSYQFPDYSVDAARNYCRDPDYTGSPWCYTVDPNVRWEFCGIQECL